VTEVQKPASSRIDPALLGAVVKIASPPTDHSPSAIGTGFVVSCDGRWASQKQRLLFLITNKHVIGDWTLADGNILEHRQSLQVSFYGGAGGAFTPVTIPLISGDGNPLPNRLALANDPKVDVAAVFLGEIQIPAGRPLSMTSLDLSYLLPFDKIASWYTGLGDQVFALGYPLGITSARTSYPIAKAGYLSTLPGEEFAIDVPCLSRNGTHSSTRLEGKLILVDGLIVPGNSGGPVVLPSELKVRLDPVTKQFQFGSEQTRNFVIGVVSMAIGSSGLTLVYGCDYVLDLINKFAVDLERAP
jgi:hypothetical protein